MLVCHSEDTEPELCSGGKMLALKVALPLSSRSHLGWWKFLGVNGNQNDISMMAVMNDGSSIDK